MVPWIKKYIDYSYNSAWNKGTPTKENTGSQMGHTKKKILKKQSPFFGNSCHQNDWYSRCQFHQHFTHAFCANILAPKNIKLKRN
jgi:hypothetical protein